MPAMYVTDIKIRKVFADGNLLAIVSLTFDSCLAVHDVKIVSTGGREIVVFPSSITASGEKRDIVHPINSSFRTEVESRVLSYFRLYAEKKENC